MKKQNLTGAEAKAPVDPTIDPSTEKLTSEADEDGKLHNAAGQAWDSEKLDKINDADAESLQLDQSILQQSGEKKGERKRTPGHG